MNPRYPVYIVSKGRWHNGLTTKALNNMGVPHYIVVEADETDKYAETTSADLLVLPKSYLDEYHDSLLDNIENPSHPNSLKDEQISLKVP